MIIKKTHKIIGIVIVIIIATMLGVVYKNTHTLPSILFDSDIVYVPDRLSNKKAHNVSIDIEEMWLFYLNEQETAYIKDEISMGKFVRLDSHHISFLKRTGWNDLIVNNISDVEYCWICIYDLNKKNIITDLNPQLSNWFVFIYDETGQKYYCVYQTT